MQIPPKCPRLSVLYFLLCIVATSLAYNLPQHRSQSTKWVKMKLAIATGSEIKLGEFAHHVFIYKMHNKKQNIYKAFCSGNIISEFRVLSSAHCFLTNRKRYLHDNKKIKLVAGVLGTHIKRTEGDGVQQWRTIEHVYSQKYFRFPAFNLALVQIEDPWIFGQFVNKIPYASKDQDFDGVCAAPAVKSTRSWSSSKFLFKEEFKMLQRRVCESRLLRSCRLYYCTDYNTRKLLLDSVESEGGGLICRETGDPMEINETQGVLVGITSLIHIHLPTMHHKVGMFHTWISDSSVKRLQPIVLIILCLIIKTPI